MAYQGILSREHRGHQSLLEVHGSDIIGSKVEPPFGVAKEVYVLPMEGVLATKVSAQSHAGC